MERNFPNKNAKNQHNEGVFERPEQYYPLLTWDDAINASKQHLPDYYHFDRLRVADLLTYLEKPDTALLKPFAKHVSQWRQDIYALLVLDEEEGAPNPLTSPLTTDFVEYLEQKRVFPEGFFEMVAFPLLREISYWRMEYDVIDGDDYLKSSSWRALSTEFGVPVVKIRTLMQRLVKAHETFFEEMIFMDNENRVLFLTTLIAQQEKLNDLDSGVDWLKVVVFRILGLINRQIHYQQEFGHEWEMGNGAFAGHYDTYEEWQREPDYWKDGSEELMYDE